MDQLNHVLYVASMNVINIVGLSDHSLNSSQFRKPAVCRTCLLSLEQCLPNLGVVGNQEQLLEGSRYLVVEYCVEV